MPELLTAIASWNESETWKYPQEHKLDNPSKVTDKALKHHTRKEELYIINKGVACKVRVNMSMQILKKFTDAQRKP